MSATTAITASATKSSGCDRVRVPRADSSPGMRGSDHLRSKRIVGSGPGVSPSTRSTAFSHESLGACSGAGSGAAGLGRAGSRSPDRVVDARGEPLPLGPAGGGQPFGARCTRIGAAIDAARRSEVLEFVALEISHGDLRIE
jgi:hypothetical protein